LLGRVERSGLPHTSKPVAILTAMIVKLRSWFLGDWLQKRGEVVVQRSDSCTMRLVGSSPTLVRRWVVWGGPITMGPLLLAGVLLMESPPTGTALAVSAFAWWWTGAVSFFLVEIRAALTGGSRASSTAPSTILWNWVALIIAAIGVGFVLLFPTALKGSGWLDATFDWVPTSCGQSLARFAIGVGIGWMVGFLVRSAWTLRATGSPSYRPLEP
jgi:hypothetical protein